MFLYHEACPKCNSKDNLARYSDGSAYCFGCRYYEPGNKLKELKTNHSKKDTSIYTSNLLYSDIPKEGLQWLNKYELTQQEIKQHGISWCVDRRNSNCGLYFPYIYNNVLVGLQIRYFGTKIPRKYKLQGNKLQMSLSKLTNQNREMPLIFVEDLVSSIRISRQFPSIPLLGCFVSYELLTEVKDKFTSFRLWLDPDKKKESLLQCKEYKQKGIDIEPIFSWVDPKDLSDNQIKSLII